jgi:hypothetical protein
VKGIKIIILTIYVAFCRNLSVLQQLMILIMNVTLIRVQMFRSEHFLWVWYKLIKQAQAREPEIRIRK